MADNVQLKDALGVSKTIGTEEIGGVHYTRLSTGVQAVTHQYASGQTGAGATLQFTRTGGRIWSIQVVGAGGTLASWLASLRLSNNGTNFTSILWHGSALTPADVHGDMKFPPGGTEYVALYAQPYLHSVNLGSASACYVTIVGMP